MDGTKYDKNTFGASVALEGDVALIGAPQQYFCSYENYYGHCQSSMYGAGFALTFARNGASDEWELSFNLTASDSVYEYEYVDWIDYEIDGENAPKMTRTKIVPMQLGTGVALSGDYALVSSRSTGFSYDAGTKEVYVNVPGAAYVFKKTSENTNGPNKPNSSQIRIRIRATQTMDLDNPSTFPATSPSSALAMIMKKVLAPERRTCLAEASRMKPGAATPN